jgi:hypothetical protein
VADVSVKIYFSSRIQIERSNGQIMLQSPEMIFFKTERLR